jgi:hypothetical protein
VRDRLPEPLLYLSPYFESHRQDYYDALQAVRERGDLDHWLALFLDGIRTQATDAVARAERLTDLRERYRTTVQAATRGIANQVAELALEQPVLTARTVETRLEVSRPAALKALRQLATSASSRKPPAVSEASSAGERTKYLPSSSRSSGPSTARSRTTDHSAAQRRAPSTSTGDPARHASRRRCCHLPADNGR